jgi:lipoprotein-anchoring transpeptidase ErfK/SrfK
VQGIREPQINGNSASQEQGWELATGFSILAASFVGALAVAIEQVLAADPRWARTAGVAASNVRSPARPEDKASDLAVAGPEHHRQPSLDSRVRPQTLDTGTAECRIVISLADRNLMLIESGRAVGVYPVAVGARRSPSPIGKFQAASRVASPTWSHHGKVVAPGKANPVGTRWLGVSC